MNTINNKMKIILNNKEVLVHEGETLLQVAEREGHKIPTLCHHPSLKSFASCFLCVVEVEVGADKHRNKQLVSSCATPVRDGMVVNTESQLIFESRKTALNLLLSDHRGDCVAPCELGCPALTDVQGYVALIGEGKYEEAIKLIKNRLALPLVCGTICPNPCEEKCRRGEVEAPIAIRALKRFAAEYDLAHGPYLPEVAPSTGKRVAIVGGGPAGLAGAFYLRKMGHQVDIFEKEIMLGGMVRYGIPKFRLDWNLLDAEINAILSLGVNVHTGKKLGVDFTIESLKQEGFDSVLLAIGAHASKRMRIPGEDDENSENSVGAGITVLQGIDFLRRVVKNELIDEKGNQKAPSRVLVVGGGDVAMDCARVARRMGAEVDVVYRRTQKEMPASKHEQDQAREEGIRFVYLKAPIAIEKTGLRVQQMELTTPDSSGRVGIKAVPDAFEEIACDMVIAAIGQELSFRDEKLEEQGIGVTSWASIKYNPVTFTTGVDGVFAAGDAAMGPKTAVAALAEGRGAAVMIDYYLRGIDLSGVKDIDNKKSEYQIVRSREDIKTIVDETPIKERFSDHVHEVNLRLSDEAGYKLISYSMSEEEARSEALRCLKCGCNARKSCKLRDYSTEYDASEKTYAGKSRNYSIDNSRKDFSLELNKCINCGMCVRACDELKGLKVFSFTHRGFASRPSTFWGVPLADTNCDGCLKCVDLCPTGSLSQSQHSF